MIPLWFLPPTDPRRIASDVRQMRLIRELERASKLAGINTRIKQ